MTDMQFYSILIIVAGAIVAFALAAVMDKEDTVKKYGIISGRCSDSESQVRLMDKIIEHERQKFFEMRIEMEAMKREIEELKNKKPQ